MRFSGNFNPEWGYLAPAPGYARTVRIVGVAMGIGAIAGVGAVLSLADRSEADMSRTAIAAHALVTPVHAATPTVIPAARVSTAAVAPTQIAEPVKEQVQAQVPAPAPVQPVQSASPAPAPAQQQARAEAIQPIEPEQAPPKAAIQAAIPASGNAGVLDSAKAALSSMPAGVAALGEVGEEPAGAAAATASVADEPAATPETTPDEKKGAKKSHGAPRHEQASGAGKPKNSKGGLAPLLRHIFSAR